MMNISQHDMTRATPVALQAIQQKPAISVVGLGYVGAVSCACLSDLGYSVLGVDVDRVKLEQIARGVAPFHEKDLDTMLEAGVEGGLISTTDNLTQAVCDTDVTFLSVGTPTAKDGGCDYSYIEAAARSIGKGLARKTEFHVVVMRCSVPPGTTLGLMTPILEKISGKVAGKDFGICFNPEFLREGVAVDDFYTPPKTVVGTTDARTANIMRQIYLPVDENVIETSIETAEMVKYVDNIWHATKVSFANEVGRLCKSLGVDGHDVMDVFVQDTKLNISACYLKPGFAYGGSCLPKEVRAVAHIASNMGVDLPLIQSLDRTNKAHIEAAIEMVRRTGAKRVGVLGIAFKPGTDDLRESPILEVMAALTAEGIKVVAHDMAITSDTPVSGQMGYVRHGSPGLQALVADLPDMLQEDISDVLEKSDALIVTHANDTYRRAVARAGKRPVLDLVRISSVTECAENYEGIGW
ncbi:UDP-glucose dehydrogenase family protein [Halocynthiibacter styelae]|uniref:UDP-glucose 6-dehydrogenase n=1 Tax=Halocynthiibacter styelae TaxID=2761955 RepID=A0A8J7IP67_9RHOB|nr:nucleotide sugar dehydrogenase [Paenihalocynthiibacter styelae]MBI1494521.1 UDP-glucose/GDP-mannose dehydrogenase family protein [Paenihalocynthiibacter styelae]